MLAKTIFALSSGQGPAGIAVFRISGLQTRDAVERVTRRHLFLLLRAPLPDGVMACVFPRSGMSLEGLVCELPPIDSAYTGEVYAIVTNLTDKLKKVPGGTRIGQLVVMPIVLADFVEQLGEERGDGAFGSTGNA